MVDPKITPHGGYWRVRLRYGDGQRQRFTIAIADQHKAQVRATKLQELAHALTRAGKIAEAPVLLKRGAEVTTERDFFDVVKVAGELCRAPALSAKLTPATTFDTFRALAEAWTDGRLHQQYPDQVRQKKTAEDAGRWLENHVLPVIGNLPVNEITLDDCERVMRQLPPRFAVASRRQVAYLMGRLLKMAVYPLRLIERSPLPTGFLPSTKQSKAKACLYPDEDRRLMAAAKVPLHFRLLWGFLSREGMRAGEALALTWGDLDLQRGAVKLDKNKTDDPRAWAMHEGTKRALVAFRDSQAVTPKPSDLVFVDESGRGLSRFGLAEQLRTHLAQIGLDTERPELFTSNEHRMRIRVHDLRGTFVTLALAAGKSEAWVSDRTGHRSSVMVHCYKRQARSFAELGLGELLPLDEAISELFGPPADRKGGPRVGHGLRIQPKTAGFVATPTRFELVLPA